MASRVDAIEKEMKAQAALASSMRQRELRLLRKAAELRDEVIELEELAEHSGNAAIDAEMVARSLQQLFEALMHEAPEEDEKDA